MLTLKETIASQKDLKKLCSDCGRSSTTEIFEPNDFYGNAAILKCYAGLPQRYALKVVVPHGVYLGDQVLAVERETPLPAILGFFPHRQEIYKKETDKVVIPSAAPLLYLGDLLKDHTQPERKGTIFFPAHSTYWVTVESDYEALAEELSSLDREFQPVTICVYWRDFNLGHHLPFQSRKMPIVSAGHIFDPLFLFRFFHLCSLHRYACSNVFGSHMFYSVKLGCRFFLLDTFGARVIAPDHIIKRDVAIPPKERLDLLRFLFDKPQRHITEDQLRVVDYYLGAAYLKRPQELRRQLLRSELLDKFGLFRTKSTNHKLYHIPSFLRRVRQHGYRQMLAR